MNTLNWMVKVCKVYRRIQSFFHYSWSNFRVFTSNTVYIRDTGTYKAEVKGSGKKTCSYTKYQRRDSGGNTFVETNHYEVRHACSTDVDRRESMQAFALSKDSLWTISWKDAICIGICPGNECR